MNNLLCSSLQACVLASATPLRCTQHAALGPFFFLPLSRSTLLASRGKLSSLVGLEWSMIATQP
jgi:hypothetical protein